ncbi:MAG: FecR domain-containing protein [Deltaproteobacteria bacterium]|nr:FecR domain-containing protein [Deltaproteobacteria bacterium]
MTTPPRTTDEARVAPLAELSGAQPSPAALRRIVSGALERTERPHTSLRLPVLALAVAGVAAFAGFVLRAAFERARPEGSSAPVATASVRRTPPPASRPLAPRGAEGPAPAASRRFTSGARSLAVALGPHRLELAPHSALRERSPEWKRAALTIEAGKVDFAVHKLGPEQSFIVQTEHLKVQVVGTRFTVEVDGPCTRVEVREGRVSVTPAQGAPLSLGAGERRTSCAPPDAAERLSAEERTVRRALAALRAPGELGRADALLASYLETYPAGLFAEEAHYHRVLVQERLGRRDQALVLARDFLRRFPRTDRAARLRVRLEKLRRE